jgi:hypothetical protein
MLPSKQQFKVSGSRFKVCFAGKLCLPAKTSRKFEKRPAKHAKGREKRRTFAFFALFRGQIFTQHPADGTRC